MKVIMMMAMTINGLIARPDGSTDWSSENWKNFKSIAQRTGNAVIGKNTYDIAKSENSIIPNCFTVVMTHDKNLKNTASTIFTDTAPTLVIDMLIKIGFKEILIAGGGSINSQFLKAALIDEIYIDIEPKIFGRGIPLFASDDFEIDLSLISNKNINNNTLALHYKVVK